MNPLPYDDLDSPPPLTREDYLEARDYFAQMRAAGFDDSDAYEAWLDEQDAEKARRPVTAG